MTKKRRPTARQKARTRINNTMESPAGANSCGDRGRGNAPARSTSSFNVERVYTELYYSHWEAKKIVNIPVEDMLREPFEFEGLDEDQSAEVETLADSLGLIKKLGMAMRLERLLGGSVIYMGVASGARLSDPIDLDALEVGCLKFMNVIPRTRVMRAEFNLNPLAANYGEPECYVVNGETVHKSRLLIFDGAPLTPNGGAELQGISLNRRNDGFGESVLEAIEDDIARAVGTRQAAKNLVDSASIWLIMTDIMNLESTKPGQERLEALEGVAQQISMYRAALLDSSADNPTSLQSVSPSFGSVPELVMSFLQVLSAASDIPATRFLGQAPGGLNATGDSDLENYYNSIESQQRQRLRPQLLKWLNIAGRSVFGPAFDITAVDVIFEPLWNLDEVQQAAVRLSDSQMISALAMAQVIDPTEANDEARARGCLIAKPIGEPDAADSF